MCKMVSICDRDMEDSGRYLTLFCDRGYEEKLSIAYIDSSNLSIKKDSGQYLNWSMTEVMKWAVGCSSDGGHQSNGRNRADFFVGYYLLFAFSRKKIPFHIQTFLNNYKHCKPSQISAWLLYSNHCQNTVRQCVNLLGLQGLLVAVVWAFNVWKK